MNGINFDKKNLTGFFIKFLILYIKIEKKIKYIEINIYIDKALLVIWTFNIVQNINNVYSTNGYFV